MCVVASEGLASLIAMLVIFYCLRYFSIDVCLGKVSNARNGRSMSLDIFTSGRLDNQVHFGEHHEDRFVLFRVKVIND